MPYHRDFYPFTEYSKYHSSYVIAETPDEMEERMTQWIKERNAAFLQIESLDFRVKGDKRGIRLWYEINKCKTKIDKA